MPGESYVSDEKLGSRFYLTLLAVVLGGAAGAILIFWLIGTAWVRWGGLGALIFIGVVLIAIGYVYDRRQAKVS